jgi:hypothetical protein
MTYSEILQNFIFWKDKIDHNKMIMSSSFHIQWHKTCSIWLPLGIEW